MRTMGRRALHRWSVGLIAATAALSACRDSGLPDRNLPLAAAEQRTFGYPTYQPLGQALTEVWELDGRRWQLSGHIEAIPQGQLRSVANANGTSMYALQWDEAPVDQLYTPVGEGRWRVVLPID